MLAFLMKVFYYKPNVIRKIWRREVYNVQNR